LRNVKSGSISVTAQEYRSIIDDISDNLFSLLAPASRASYDGSFNAYKKCGVGSKLANKVASIDALSSAYDIIEVSKKLNTQITNVSQIYFKVGTRLHLKWLRNKILTSNTDNYWQRISTKTILEDLYHYQMKITSVIVEHGSCDKEGCDGDFALDQWIKTEDFLVGRYDRFINDFKSQANPDLSMFIVALNRIKALISKS
jgi:NAD-specific glutamate dehydrogenase